MEGRRRGGWKRILLWTFVGVCALMLVMAGGSYLWFRNQVAGANARVSPEVQAALAERVSTTTAPTGASAPELDPNASLHVDPAEPPSGMNLLVLGSDRRKEDEGDRGRSDTIILVHIDPDRDYLSVLSVPRDLRVKIPGHGRAKINAAYAYGGPELTIRTVQQVTGVDIDHYVEIDFEAFKDLTDSLGGVYVDVDRRYHNENANWELIRLAPGYQRLNGDQALDWVRFRHDQSHDFGRMDRQQQFLNAAREQAMGWDLAFKLPKLVTALFRNIGTDLGANDILRLASWGIGLDGGRIKQVSMIGATETIAGASYVLMDEKAIARVVDDFFAPPGTVGPTSTADGSSTTTTSDKSTSTSVAGGSPLDLTGMELDVLNANGRSGEAGVAAEWLRNLGATVVTVGNFDGPRQSATSVDYPSGMQAEARRVAKMVGTESVKKKNSAMRIAVVLGKDFAIPTDVVLPPSPSNIPDSGGWKTIAQTVPFVVRAPAYIPKDYFFVERMPTTGATYDIDKGSDKGKKPAFKMVYRLIENGEYKDQCMGITETTWLDAPAAGKGQQIKKDGVTFTVVGTDQKVDRVWWKADGVLYWVSNTLSHLLSKEELLAVAESMLVIPAK